MGSSLDTLTRLIMEGMPTKERAAEHQEQTKAAIDGMFGERYHAKSPYAKRVAFMSSDEHTSFAGLVHSDSPPSGVYGGMSLIWFPIEADGTAPGGSLLTLVCGTRGLSPDEQILGRPGHARHLRALQRFLNESGIATWIKHDPTNLSEPFPKVVQKDYERFEGPLKRYGSHIYLCVEVPDEYDKASIVVRSLVDFYATERNWMPLKAHAQDIAEFKLNLRRHLFPRVSRRQILDLLRQRRFVILQGPPGTGKTRIAAQILKEDFSNNGFSVQFHPAVSYETFVAGISPRVDGDSLHFEVKPGWLVEAITQCNGHDFLMHLDEINRADLSRVLGEAMYLFEPREIAEGNAREVRLPSPVKGQDRISIPKSLYVLGTMNSADRSIAIMDMAVRRRFAFVDIWPDIDVIEGQGLEMATEAFARLQDIFAQYATDDSFCLLPGHSYFLANSETELAARLKYEVLPLLHEYLMEGRLTTCESELRAYMDWLSSQIQQHGY